jgi:DNA processing protein
MLSIEGSAHSERLAFLALASVKGVGHKTLHAMARDGKRFGDALAINRTDEAIELLRHFGARIDGSSGTEWHKVRRQAFERASRLLGEFSGDGTKILFQGDHSFPRALLDLPNPPFWLFVKGDAGVLNRPTLAVVGTRNPSEDGRFLAQFVGACLAEWKMPTISGLAVGIDQIIHSWSLRAKLPTVAILGTAIHSDYPKGAAELKKQIVAQGGALVTEYLPRETYSAQNFVMRNRLQAALSRVLIPVEWYPRSGSAHTIRFASSLKRPIACLRMPDWEIGRLTLSRELGAETGRIFTVPGEEGEFRNYVKSAVERPIGVERPQLSQFGFE